MWDADEYVRAAAIAAQRVAESNAAAQAGATPVVELATPAAIAAELDLEGRLERGLGVEALGEFLDAYLARSTHLHHPASLAHQVAVPDVGAALGDLVHGAINNPMAVYEMGPAAATVELVVINRLLAAVGFRPQPLDGSDDGASGAGVLTSGGSLANLTALLAARAAVAPDAWQDGVPDDLVVLVPPTSHYSVARAVAIMGLGARAVRPLPVGRHGVLDPEGVAATIAEVRRAGLRPLAVVANAPSTATGLHDPLRALGQVCRAAGVWLHVDAAHGASALLSPRERHHLDGIDLADSVTWDAHKMLRTAGLCAAVLFRRARSFDAAFSEEASYLFYDDGDARWGPDLIHRTVECTKAGLGLKAFLALAWRGEADVAHYVEDRYAAARRVAALLRARDGFTVPYEPESNIVCFRYGDDDAEQLAIRRALLDSGRAHLSSAEVDGVRHLRMVLTAPAADEAALVAVCDAVADAARRTAVVTR